MKVRDETMVSICAAYRARFDEWPMRLDVALGIRDELQWVLGDHASTASCGVELRVDPQVDYLRAIRVGGSIDYSGVAGAKPVGPITSA